MDRSFPFLFPCFEDWSNSFLNIKCKKLSCQFCISKTKDIFCIQSTDMVLYWQMSVDLKRGEILPIHINVTFPSLPCEG